MAHTTMPSLARYRHCFLAATMAFLCTAATKLNNPALQFQVTIPDGFERNQEQARDKDDLYSYIRPASDPSKANAVIRIRRLRGTLPTDYTTKGFSKDGVRVEPMSVTWRTHTLPGAKFVTDVGGVPVVSMTVPVPLKPEAISISVAGGLGDEQEVSDLLHGVLASVEGETNWVSEGGRVVTEEAKKAEELFAKDVYVCVAVLAVIGFAVYIWRRNRREGSGG